MNLPPLYKPMPSSAPSFLLRYRHLLTLTLLLLPTVPRTLAQRFVCHEPAHDHDPNYPAPSIADCQHLFSHLPRVNNDYFSFPAGNRLISRSHPFQPPSHLTHGNCRLAVHLFTAPTPPHLRDTEDPVPEEVATQAVWDFLLEPENLNAFPDALPESIVAYIWKGTRRLGGELLEVCVEEQQRAGVVVGRLGDWMPDSWYYISIGTLGDITSVLDSRVTSRARARLHGLLLPAFEGQPTDLFNMPSYQV